MMRMAPIDWKAGPRDFVLRSLWPDIGALETALSQMQKVCNELAAAYRARRLSRAGALHNPKNVVSSYVPA